MLKESKTTSLEYQKLSAEEMKRRGILGRLVGVCADFINPTRNGRTYSEELWEKVFDSDLMKEKIANRVCYGELGHPADREETDMEKVAVCLAEQPMKGSDGKLRAVFDILNTKNGQILKTLCDYGSTLGISSRGTGDLISDYDGKESVDPETYSCEGFDIVLVPAVKEARLQYVSEALNKTRYGKTLRQTLSESLEKSSEEDRKLMEESLNMLGIDLAENTSKEQDKGLTITESSMQELEGYFDEWSEANPFVNLDKLIVEFNSDLASVLYSEEKYDEFVNWAKSEHGITINPINEALEKNDTGETGSDTEQGEEVVDDKSDVELVAEFQESLLKIKKLEEDNLSLQEQLSVGNAKEVKLNEELTRYKAAVVKLSDDVKNYKPMKDEVNKLNNLITEKDDAISANNSRINWLVESRKRVQENFTSTKKLNEDLTKKLDEMSKELSSTNKQVENLSKQLDNSNVLVEKYKRSYKALKEAYVEIKASNYGLRKEDVLGKLNESYKIRDIDKVCEELSQLKANMKKLPFRLTEDTKVSVKASDNEYIKGGLDFGDDLISDSLLQLANIK